jgi:hypothetical protein
VPQRFATRFLTIDDIPALLQLEKRQWEAHQAASAEALRQRIENHPRLCMASFCPRSGEVIASLFMRPISRQEIQQARTWTDCSVGASPSSSVERPSSLFGISLTSVEPQAALALFDFFWPQALKNGWRDIYLGSPIPGLQRALAADPHLDVHTYVRAKRGGLPRDTQLRYYHRKGFQEIVSVLPNYFPHEASLNHGVLLRGHVPLSRWCLLWSLLPMGLLQALLKGLVRLSGVQAGRAKPSDMQGVTS